MKRAELKQKGTDKAIEVADKCQARAKKAKDKANKARKEANRSQFAMRIRRMLSSSVSHSESPPTEANGFSESVC